MLRKWLFLFLWLNTALQTVTGLQDLKKSTHSYKNGHLAFSNLSILSFINIIFSNYVLSFWIKFKWALRQFISPILGNKRKERNTKFQSQSRQKLFYCGQPNGQFFYTQLGSTQCIAFDKDFFLSFWHLLHPLLAIVYYIHKLACIEYPGCFDFTLGMGLILLTRWSF